MRCKYLLFMRAALEHCLSNNLNEMIHMPQQLSVLSVGRCCDSRRSGIVHCMQGQCRSVAVLIAIMMATSVNGDDLQAIDIIESNSPRFVSIYISVSIARSIDLNMTSFLKRAYASDDSMLATCG